MCTYVYIYIYVIHVIPYDMYIHTYSIYTYIYIYIYIYYVDFEGDPNLGPILGSEAAVALGSRPLCDSARALQGGRVSFKAEV